MNKCLGAAAVRGARAGVVGAAWAPGNTSETCLLPGACGGDCSSSAAANGTPRGDGDGASAACHRVPLRRPPSFLLSPSRSSTIFCLPCALPSPRPLALHLPLILKCPLSPRTLSPPSLFTPFSSIPPKLFVFTPSPCSDPSAQPLQSVQPPTHLLLFPQFPPSLIIRICDVLVGRGGINP